MLYCLRWALEFILSFYIGICMAKLQKLRFDNSEKINNERILAKSMQKGAR